MFEKQTYKNCLQFYRNKKGLKNLAFKPFKIPTINF